MKNLHILGSMQMPEVNFETSGLLSIKGISTPENVMEFYNPLFNWVSELIKTKPNSITFKMFFDYLNTSSTRVLVELIKQINQQAKNNNIEVSFIWQYEDDDEDMMEFGEELQIVTAANIELREVTL